MPDTANPILFYDGVCGLCNRLVQFVLEHDTHARFRFATLQSAYAARTLQAHGFDLRDLDTVYVRDESGELLARSGAVIYILRRLGGFWRVLGTALRIFPKFFCEWGYRLGARHRYRIFGKYESCPLPEPKYQNRFLEK